MQARCRTVKPEHTADADLFDKVSLFGERRQRGMMVATFKHSRTFRKLIGFELQFLGKDLPCC